MKPRPSGVITFLFTDIEGSTALWEGQPDAMRASLERHDEILRGVCDACNGYVFKTVGDAFCVAFKSAADAVKATFDAQVKLSTQDWGEAPLRVRMGLHSGESIERDDDYFGPSLNRAARLMAIAHGGQVLLSSATEQLLGGHLPMNAQLVDLGLHRLKDLLQPEHVWQLQGPQLAASFPPLRSLDARLTNLPLQLTPFIGRERDVAGVLERLGQAIVRLLTLTGPGGTGKTRLALQVGAELVDHFANGVWFVPLASVIDPARVPDEIARTFDFRENAHEQIVKTLVRRLHEQQLLLVLDNFEQVVAAAPVLSELLAGAPQIKIMVTSREVLDIYGEHVHPVPPLGLPDLARPQSPATLSQCDAVSLFVQTCLRPPALASRSTSRTRTQWQRFACAWTGSRSLSNLQQHASPSSRRHSYSRAWASGSRRWREACEGLPERQRTLRGAIDWSHELLSSDEKRLFARLAVFEGGLTYDSAEAVCGPGLDLGILEGLQSLIKKSLIQTLYDVNGNSRFVMLETLHEYAREQLAMSGEGRKDKRCPCAPFPGAGRKGRRRKEVLTARSDMDGG